MFDKAMFSRVTGTQTVGNKDVPVLTAVGTTKAYVQTYEAFEQTPEAGGHVYTKQRYKVHVPIGFGPVRVGDICTIIAATFDVELKGRTYRVAGLLHKTQATAQRLLVDEVTA